MSQISKKVTPCATWGDPIKHSEAAIDHPWFKLLSGIYTQILESTTNYYIEEDIKPVIMPITVSSVSSPMGIGSDSEPVATTVNGDQVYLADSMQFQLEFMLRYGYRGVYYVMPTFRGEDHDETHLNQFFHSEAEIIGDLKQVKDIVNNYIKAICEDLMESPIREALEAALPNLAHIEKIVSGNGFPEISYKDAKSKIGSAYFTDLSRGVEVITRQGEKRLIEEFDGPVWLSNPPHLSVPFYQKKNRDGTAEAADLLMGIGEVVGCGERHINAEELKSAIEHHKITDNYDWYLRMKEKVPLKTSGFGLGIERFILWLLQHDDIRDLQIMPRLKGIPGHI